MFQYQRKLVLFLLFFFSLTGLGYTAQPVQVQALVGSDNVSMGEVFVLQIRVNGSTDVQEPDMSGVKDFSCSFVGGAPSNSVFTSIVNGVKNVVQKKSYIINYKLTPLKKGNFTIPPLKVIVDNSEYFTEPINIKVASQQVNNDSFIRYKLGRDTYYLGETFPLELVWYFRNNATLTGIDVPAFTDDRFIISKSSKPASVPAGSRLIDDININGSHYWALQGQDVVNGVAYNTVSLKVYLTPRTAGEVSLKPASIMSQVVVGYKEASRRSRFPGVFDDFDNFFGDNPFNVRQPVVREFSATTLPVSIDILSLPPGQPVNYTGVVSKVTIADKAQSSQVSVGEPVNVTVMVAGNDNLYNLQLPDYNYQSDIKNKFKVTADSDGGKIIGNARIFNLVFRALDESVNEIPPLKLAYFDVNDKKYKQVQSNAIPLKVKAAKIVTASDIEAVADYSSVADPSVAEKSHISGILYNYTDDSVLDNKNINFITWVDTNKLFLAGFPCGYCSLLLLQFFWRRRNGSETIRKANRAYREFDSIVKDYQKRGITADKLTGALIYYFKNKFRITAREMTLAEIYEELSACSKIENDSLDNCKKIFDYCEACSYSASKNVKLSDDFVRNVVLWVADIDSKIK